jgi:hypothetical protein
MLLGATAAGMLLFTEPGRRWARRTGRTMQERFEALRRGGFGRPPVERMIEDAVTEPHEDTVMAHAFEEAVQSG